MTMKTLSLALLAAVPMLAQTTYNIDSPHSSAQFSVKHMMVSNVKGEFGGITGTVVYDAKNPSATQIDATIDVRTINTREAARDTHLKSPDFFDAAKYPTMTFKSKQAWSSGGALIVKGDLTMHGVTHEVQLTVDGPSAEVKDPYGNQRVGASATTKINRKDWGLTWNQVLEAGALVVGEEVSITLDIEATRQQPKK